MSRFLPMLIVFGFLIGIVGDYKLSLSKLFNIFEVLLKNLILLSLLSSALPVSEVVG